MASQITEGDEAPDFTLRDENGEAVTLSDRLEEGPVMLVFYPGDFTPACTRQMCSYRDRYEEFRELGIEIIGISDDEADSHEKFRSKYELPFTLLADPDHQVIEKYGGSGLLSAGGAHRANFLIDAKGIVRYAHVEKVSLFYRKPEELLEAAERLVGDELT